MSDRWNPFLPQPRPMSEWVANPPPQPNNPKADLWDALNHASNIVAHLNSEGVSEVDDGVGELVEAALASMETWARP